MGLFSSKQKSKTESKPYNPGQVQGWMSDLYGLSQTPQQFFPDQTFASMDPLQREGLQAQEAAARGMQGGIMDPSTQAWQSMLNAPDVANNPYVQGMLEQQANLANRNLSENMLPAIRMGHIGGGSLGSSRQGVAEGLAARGTQEALLGQAAQTQMGAYQAGLGSQAQGVAGTPGIMQAQMMPGAMMGQVGGARRAEEQLGVDEAMARHQFAQNEPWQRSERFAQSYFPATSPYGTSTSTSKTSPSGLQIAGQLGGAALTGALGAGAMGFGPAAGMFSGAAGGAGAGGMMGPMMGTMAANQIPGIGTQGPTARGLFPNQWGYQNG